MPITPKISPCLWFDDQAEEAAKFYTSVFPNSKVLAVTLEKLAPDVVRPVHDDPEAHRQNGSLGQRLIEHLGVHQHLVASHPHVAIGQIAHERRGALTGDHRKRRAADPAALRRPSS